MLKKFYDKSRIWFAVTWIVIYCVMMSAADAISATVGIEKAVTLPVGLLLSAVLFIFLKKNALLVEYGFCKPRTSHESMLYYAPVLLMLVANLCYGFSLDLTPLEAVLAVLSMLAVGFLEEVIFRGLLFEAMRGESPAAAVAVSSLTFGIGHIINLFNGSGAELLPNLLQVLYATAAGFMFVMIYYKSKSIIVCIASHGVFNALGVFADEAAATQALRISVAITLALLTAGYGAYIAFGMRGKKEE